MSKMRFGHLSGGTTSPLVSLARRLRDSLDYQLGAIGIAAIVAGVFYRVWDLGYPNLMTFDEVHFVNNARNYIAGLADVNDHPPLGKLMIAVGILMLDDHGLGWRIVPLMFGLQSIALAYFLGKHLFDDWRAGVLAAIFIAIDGFFICYSSTALMDGMLAALMLWSMLATVLARSAKDIAIAAILIGLAATVKWTGVMMVIPVVVWVVVVKRYPWRWLLVLALVPIVHVAIWSFALWISDQPHSVPAVYAVMRRLLKQHLSRGSFTHVAMSKWYTWPILLHPITLRSYHTGLHIRTLSSIGNPFLWLSTTLAIVGCACAMVVRFVRTARNWKKTRVWKSDVTPRDGLSFRALLFALTCWVSPLIPWMIAKRDCYMYHYLPSYAFGLVLFGGIVAWLFRRRRIAAWLIVLTVCAVSIYYAPISSQLPLSHPAFEHRILFESWR
jgi:dolichyl-phosphate-mannose-protein mannosyltransferase